MPSSILQLWRATLVLVIGGPRRLRLNHDRYCDENAEHITMHGVRLNHDHNFDENAEHITPCMVIDDSVKSGLARGPGMGRKSPRRDVHYHPGYCLCAQVL